MKLKLKRDPKAERLAKNIHESAIKLCITYRNSPLMLQQIDQLIREQLDLFLRHVSHTKCKNFMGVDVLKETKIVAGYEGTEAEILFCLKGGPYLLRTFKADTSDYFTWDLVPDAQFAQREPLLEVPGGAKVIQARANTTFGVFDYNEAGVLTFTTLDKRLTCIYGGGGFLLFKGSLGPVNEEGVPKVLLDALDQAGSYCVPKGLWRSIERSLHDAMKHGIQVIEETHSDGPAKN